MWFLSIPNNSNNNQNLNLCIVKWLWWSEHT